MTFLLFGLVTLSFGYQTFQKGIESENWPSTDGIILSSHIGTHHSKDSTTYGASITYQYTVEGLNYTSDRVSFGYGYSSDYGAASRLVQDNPPGKIVTIHYDSQNPSEAVLLNGVDNGSLILIAFGSIFLLIGVIIIIVFIVLRRKKKLGKQISITLQKTNFNPGEIIVGTINLNLKKPRTAKSLKVAIIGERLMEQRDRRGSSSSVYPIYRTEIILDDEKEYLNETYHLQIKIPSDILQKAKDWGTDGTGYVLGKQVQLGERTAALQKKSKKILEWAESKGLTHINQKDSWFVETSLEIQNALDIKNRVEISITEVQLV